MISIELVTNGIVAVLLAVTIGYAFVLNRRLQHLRQNQDELMRLASVLNQATARAQEGIYELKAASQAAEETLKREINRARGLADELALITEAGNNLADKLESGLTRRVQAEKAAQPSVRLAAGRDIEAPSMDVQDKRRHALKAAR